MKSILRNSLNLLATCMAVAVIFTLSQGVVEAQELTVDGSTAGSTFTPGGSSNGGLSFTGTNFGGTTSGGILELSNMGRLTINPSTIGESTGTFTLSVAFRRPNGLFVNPVTVFGEVFGFYTDEANFALIDFNNNPQVINFSGAYGTGTFALAVDDVCLFLGEPCSFDRIDGPEGDVGSASPLIRGLRRHKSLALNSAQRGDGKVKFVKAKGSSTMLAQDETFTITATIEVLAFAPASVDQCKKDGWRNFLNPTYRNQGECVSSFNHAAKEDR